jgi:hypothetical protein
VKKLSLRIAFLVLGSAMAVPRMGYGQVLPPTISKAFGAATVPLNGETFIDIVISNSNPLGVNLTGLAFTDTLPAGLIVATPNGLTSFCGGTATATECSNTISLTGANLPGTGSCEVTVNVTGIFTFLALTAVDPTSSTRIPAFTPSSANRWCCGVFRSAVLMSSG